MSGLGNLCRLCFQSAVDGIDLFEVLGTGIEESYSQKLMTIFRIQLDDVIHYPTMGCVDCIQKLDDIDTFRKRILLTQQQLMETISIVKVECDPLDAAFLPSDDDSKDIPQLPVSPPELDVKEEKKEIKKVPKRNTFPTDLPTRKSTRPRTAPKQLQIEDPRKSKSEIMQINRLRMQEIQEQREERRKAAAEKVREQKQKLGITFDATALTPEEKSSLQEMIRQLNLYTCSVCQKEQFNTFNELKRHMMDTHKLPKGHVVCCNYKFINTKRILEHMKYHLDKDTFRCDDCGKRMKCSIQLTLHKKVKHPNGEAPKFYCETCGREFASKARMRIHALIHLPMEQREFPCDKCEKVFVTNGMLRFHVISVHEQNPQICEVCGKNFSNALKLNAHLKGHQEKSMTPCKICGKYVSDIKYHVKIVHTQRMTCEKCGGTFSTKGTHKKTCQAKLTKPCAICGKEISQSYFKTHMDMHRGVRKSCYFCPATATCSGNLVKHLKLKHAKEYEEYKAKRYNMDMKDMQSESDVVPDQISVEGQDACGSITN